MQWFGAAMAILVVVAVVGLAIALAALKRNSDERNRLVDRVDPALVSTLRLQTALLDEETGVRGYVLSKRDVFLEPYTTGRRDERATTSTLERLAMLPGAGRFQSNLRAVERRAQAWRRDYAEVAIAAVQRGDLGAIDDTLDTTGKTRFDGVRAALVAQARNLTAERADARADLRSAARLVLIWVAIFGALVVITVLATTIGLRRIVVRPLADLAQTVREVAEGAFGRDVAAEGPREIAELGTDVDAMRRRILAELESLEAAREELTQRAHELQRSNAELEQFAYVASHDLQEPLRKVASFCQMLERRYGDQLDERGHQYIAFAVDGAKRMQDLINDLLAFSRVGRLTDEQVDVDLGAVVEEIRGELGGAIEETGARVDVGPLPTVRGDRSLLAAVFRNLIANAIKFRGDDPPVVRISALRDEGAWDFTVADNGIGIDDEYAERIFVIFQRLHTRAVYEGTGIGLAVCRKIIEYHGGRIWLQSSDGLGGATFRFTLPTHAEEAPTA
jgi:signal transduction histidine kinase